MPTPKLNEIRVPVLKHLNTNDPSGPKNTVGLVNEKLEVVVPIIYDQLDVLADESTRYNYHAFSETRFESYPAYTNYYANIRDGRLKVTLKGVDQELQIK